MNPVALVFFIVCAITLLSVERKWAPAALLVGCTYITLGQGIEIASLSLPVYRMMLLTGIVRVIIRGEKIAGEFNLIDTIMTIFGCWILFASFFHDQNRYGFVYACGLVFNLSSIYFLFRIWCVDLEEIRGLIVVIVFLLLPIAVEMLMEKVTGKNLFSIFGGVSEYVMNRQGKLRAQGPFLHPILAGTVGASCIPLFVGLFTVAKYRTVAILGIATGLVMTFASASSGPVMTLIFGCGALVMWRFRDYLGKLRIAVIVTYIALIFLMNQPPYYLISRIDISGGSTGWHRSFLIEQTFKHLSEWWLFGTDVTRHWMPMQGIGSDHQHTDITNYYIGFGVQAGLPAMLLLIGVILLSFAWVGKTINSCQEKNRAQSFMVWSFGACLFAHVGTSISVSYFDQSMLFFWLPIAVISAGYSIIQSQVSDSVLEDLSVYLVPENILETTGISGAEWRRHTRVQVLSGKVKSDENTNSY